MVDEKELSKVVQTDFYMAAVMVALRELLMVDLMAALLVFLLVVPMAFEMVG